MFVEPRGDRAKEAVVLVDSRTSAVEPSPHPAKKAEPKKPLPPGVTRRWGWSRLRPFGMMACDNKMLGLRQVLIVMCLVTGFALPIFVGSKADNGYGFQEFVATTGAHKLPYHCTILRDSCGSMVHVDKMADRFGIRHAPFPPNEQSLNPSGKFNQFCMGKTNNNAHRQSNYSRRSSTANITWDILGV
jgi:hypothetical protein